MHPIGPHTPDFLKLTIYHEATGRINCSPWISSHEHTQAQAERLISGHQTMSALLQVLLLVTSIHLFSKTPAESPAVFTAGHRSRCIIQRQDVSIMQTSGFITFRWRSRYISNWSEGETLNSSTVRSPVCHTSPTVKLDGSTALLRAR